MDHDSQTSSPEKNNTMSSDTLKALTVYDTVQVSYRRSARLKDIQACTSSADLYRLLKHFYNPDTVELREEFWAVFFNRANKPLAVINAGIGNEVGTTTDLKLIWKIALDVRASYFVVSHNHPSSNLKPSPADIKLTRTLADGSKLLDLTLLDHIIFSSTGYYSFADDGRL
jgi:DNA repair protein RadC